MTGEKARFHELDLNHKFQPYDSFDRDTLEEGRKRLQGMTEDLAKAIYWFCVRHWLDKECQSDLYEMYFAGKVKKRHE